ncbi:MAG TPA: SRPBCC domain-containing protein [Streptosporangiaceae bacterium]|nr:SRPBCC domain-containing protein [Streptosporangiaceae bacterium]
MSEREPSYELNVSRIFTAPPRAVYLAFVSADLLAEWLPPAGWSAQREQVEIDARPGGRLRYTVTSTRDAARRIVTSAVFDEVEEGRLLAWSEEVRPEPAALEAAEAVRVELHEEPGGSTRLELRAGPYTEAGEIEAREFWNLASGRLDLVLEHSSSGV